MRSIFSVGFLRSATASVALLSSSLMASAPLVHGAAHHRHADDHHASAAAVAHSSSEADAPGLHDESLRSARGVPIAVLPTTPAEDLAAVGRVERVPTGLAETAAVRAPFPQDPARAPPLA